MKKDLSKFYVTMDEFVWKNRDHYQHSQLWDITVRQHAKCFCTLLRLIFLTALLGYYDIMPTLHKRKLRPMNDLPLYSYEELSLRGCCCLYQNQFNLLRAKCDVCF